MIFPLLDVQSFFGELGGEAPGATWEQLWLPLTMMAVITVFIIYTAFLILARAFNIRELEMYSKSEMLQTAATAFIAIFLVALVNGAIGLSATVLAIGAGEEVEGGYTPTVEVLYICEDEQLSIKINSERGMDQMIDGIRCRIKEKAVQVASAQRSAATGSGTWAEFNVKNMDISMFGITIFRGDWVPSLYEGTETKRIINNLATVLLVSLNAQIFFLSYVKSNMIHVFLPMGVLLRGFNFTRGVGALFMSMAIGLYFVFPVVFTLLDPGFVGVVVPEAAPMADISQYCYPTMSSATTMFTMAQESSAAIGTGSLEMGNLKDALAKVYVSLLVHPLISLFLTLIVVRYLMTILGGDPYALVKLVTKVI